MTDNQGAIIETKTASLETMAVTIQALHVNGKQMTLAVFRQLPRGQFEPGSHAAWGTVNYKIDGLSQWLVFECGGRLYRDLAGVSGLPRHFDREMSIVAYVKAANLPQLFIAV